jgi:hypothetical protein
MMFRAVFLHGSTTQKTALNINYSIYSSYVAPVLQKRHETSVAWPAYNVVRHSSSQVSDFVSIYIS